MRGHPDGSVELSVEAIGAAGDGIARWRGEPVFLPFTAPGDRVRARLGSRRGGGWEGHPDALLVAGPGRSPPPCRHFGECGGCALQHLDPALYRRVKLGALTAALERAGIDPGIVAPLRTVPPARRRARLGLVRPRDALQPAGIGFRRRWRHDLIDLRECLVLEPALFALVEPLRRIAAALLTPGGAGEATLTRTDSGVDLLFEIRQTARARAIRGLGRTCRGGRSRPDRLALARHGNPDRRTPPGSRAAVGDAGHGAARRLLQASEAAEQILVAEVAAGIGPQRPALDLYAGLGSFALALAEAGIGPVHAVEARRAPRRRSAMLPPGSAA